MATQKQIEANRLNAQRSTGPRTPEGKAAVRLNALRHGLRARTVVLPGEDRQEFERLCDILEAEWQPRTATELFYLEQMAVSQWKLTRMEVGEVDVYHEVSGAKTQVPLLDRLWRAQCRMERSYARAQRELERIQSSRAFQAQQPQDDFAFVEPADEPQPPAAAAPPDPAPDPFDGFPNAANFPPQTFFTPTLCPRPAHTAVHQSHFSSGAALPE
jgi:hypothetical protein